MGDSTGHADLWTVLDPEAALLMWRDGMTFAEIARVFDCTLERVRQVVKRDVPQEYADWQADRIVKIYDKRHCPECGGKKSHKAKTCRGCSEPDYSSRTIWTRETVIERIQAWNETYGRPPAARDWNPAQARSDGREDIARRFEDDGCWPATNTVQHVFGSWSKGIEAAGFTPRGSGKRDGWVPPASSAFGEAA